MTPDKWHKEHGYWSDFPGYPMEDWRSEIINNDTRQGYWDWVDGRIEEDSNEAEDGSYNKE